ncbi:hypothetical protein PC129_g15239 [Phytophthora cactorum]|uniref:Uncharacterized protein n=3 Tax=Phytophthora cactorum TaxID=29920 RepID=A0A8T1C4Y6_9STRA|nr:hypothetical protein PC112_g16791 [Phytophthora cactorum]KAG2810436.1 hypothetical protein PC111_g15658 [Phytophthora cactorum]KAG2915928.1 hypothetical protein PC117_g17875 [Phytophthora cactorum]KAG2997655.1 hypothetical protein PC119_g17637 [Phytophthora cactorum]KAG3213836.1 hypothetical protein PC129_g15239 [Phytophthora cactorum]
MRARLAACGSRMLQSWKRLQVTYHGGKYSIQRLLALEAYTRSALSSRVLLLCIATPLPMATLVILQELIPLQDPKDGWKANYGFWLRDAITAFVVNLTNLGQAPFFITDLPISKLQLVIVAACTSTAFTAVAILIVAHFRFPVPFFLMAFAPLYYVVQIIVFRIVIGTRIFYRMLAQRFQLERYMAFITIQFTLVLLYPAYEAVFHVAEETWYHFLVILLLPVIKVVVKNMVLRCTIHLEDMMPEAAIFTVDYFNAIYVATCVQSSSSASAIMAITITDLTQALLMLYGLHRHTARTLPKLGRIVKEIPLNDSVLLSLSTLCRDLVNRDKQLDVGIRVRSCIPHQLSPIDEELIDKLDFLTNTTRVHVVQKAAIEGHREDLSWDSNSTSITGSSWCSRRRSDVIYPSIQLNTTPAEKLNILREALGVLFTTECLVVAAYLEAVVPLFYSGYMLVMVHFPSAQYHSEMVGVTRENVGATVFPVFVFAVLQIVAFVLLGLLIKRNCGMRALWQLAFVLESQMFLIQGKLMVWIMITLCCRLAHFGFDFTFKSITS